MKHLFVFPLLITILITSCFVSDSEIALLNLSFHRGLLATLLGVWLASWSAVWLYEHQEADRRQHEIEQAEEKRLQDFQDLCSQIRDVVQRDLINLVGLEGDVRAGVMPSRLFSSGIYQSLLSRSVCAGTEDNDIRGFLSNCALFVDSFNARINWYLPLEVENHVRGEPLADGRAGSRWLKARTGILAQFARSIPACNESFVHLLRQAKMDEEKLKLFFTEKGPGKELPEGSKIGPQHVPVDER